MRAPIVPAEEQEGGLAQLQTATPGVEAAGQDKQQRRRRRGTGMPKTSAGGNHANAAIGHTLPDRQFALPVAGVPDAHQSVGRPPMYDQMQAMQPPQHLPMRIPYNPEGERYPDFDSGSYEAGQILKENLTEYSASAGRPAQEMTIPLHEAISGGRDMMSDQPPGGVAGLDRPPLSADQQAACLAAGGFVPPPPLMPPLVDPMIWFQQYHQLMLQGALPPPAGALPGVPGPWPCGANLGAASSPWPWRGVGVQGPPGPLVDNIDDTPAPRRRTQSGANGSKDVPEIPESEKTTIMLKGIPCNLTPHKVQTLLNLQGFASRYDFLYVPYDCERKAGPGYAFVNFVCHDDARKARLPAREGGLQGFSNWNLVSSTSKKVCEVPWAENGNQGLERNIERYRNSPLMHEDAPQELKDRRPMLFKDGERVEFPKPTKPPPRWKPKSF